MLEPLKELVLQGASTAEVKAEAIRGGMNSGSHDIRKACGGESF